MATSTCNKNAQKFCCEINSREQGKKHVELHSHLLGSGDDGFWVDDVMKNYLTRRFSYQVGREYFVNEFPPPTIFDGRTRQFVPKEDTITFLNKIKVDAGGIFDAGGGKGGAIPRDKTGQFPTYYIADEKISQPGETLEYDIKIPSSFFHAQIGWICSGFVCDHSVNGCGDDENSWSFDGLRKLKWHNNEREPCEAAWEKGDVMHVACTVRANDDGVAMATMSFTINSHGVQKTIALFEDKRFTGELQLAVTMKLNHLGHQIVPGKYLTLHPVSPDYALQDTLRTLRKQAQDENPCFPKAVFAAWWTDAAGCYVRDVVYPADKLADAFCLPSYEENVRKNYVLERLGCTEDVFRPYVVFDAREQQFVLIKWGITNADLLKIFKANTTHQCFIRNAFAMLSPSGDAANIRDFASYRGHFTPQFYPGRFALKDPIYSQRLDILHRLLEHLHGRAEQSFVEYFELSIGIGDASRMQVMAFLSRRVAQSTSLTAALVHELLNLQIAAGDKVVFKYLAGLNRQDVKLSIGASPRQHSKQVVGELQKLSKSSENPHRSWAQMVEYPHRCVNVFWDAFRGNSVQNTLHPNEFHGIFDDCLKKVDEFQHARSPDEFQDIVGFDFFGDEFAAPYCPFALAPFLKFSNQLGYRFHFGEAVPSMEPSCSGFAAWIVHMYIGLVSIYKCFKNPSKVRIGHGVAIARLLNGEFIHRVRTDADPALRILFEHALACSRIIFGTLNPNPGTDRWNSIPLEINLTSNSYLLHNRDEAKLVLGLFPEARCFLSTDDDGVWPLNGSDASHQQIGLHGEYVMAVSSGLITRAQAEQMIECARSFKFEFSEIVAAKGVPQDHTDGRNAFFDKRYATKVLFHPSTLEFLRTHGVEGVVTFCEEYCPWLQAPFPEPRSPVDRASVLLTRLVFSWPSDTMAIDANCEIKDEDKPKLERASDLFVRLLSKLCRFFVEDTFMVLRASSSKSVDEYSGSKKRLKKDTKSELEVEEYDILVTENHLQRSNLEVCLEKLSEFRRISNATTNKVRLNIFIFVDSTWPELDSAFYQLEVYGWAASVHVFTATESKTLPAFPTEIPATARRGKPQQLPCWRKEMTVFPLFYHSAFIPKLADYCFDHPDHEEVVLFQPLLSVAPTYGSADDGAVRPADDPTEGPTGAHADDAADVHEDMLADAPADWNIILPLVPFEYHEKLYVLFQSPSTSMETQWPAKEFFETLLQQDGEGLSLRVDLKGFALHVAALVWFGVVPKVYEWKTGHTFEDQDWLMPPLLVESRGVFCLVEVHQKDEHNQPINVVEAILGLLGDDFFAEGNVLKSIFTELMVYTSTVGSSSARQRKDITKRFRHRGQLYSQVVELLFLLEWWRRVVVITRRYRESADPEQRIHLKLMDLHRYFVVRYIHRQTFKSDILKLEHFDVVPQELLFSAMMDDERGILEQAAGSD